LGWPWHAGTITRRIIAVAVSAGLRRAEASLAGPVHDHQQVAWHLVLGGGVAVAGV
jgi:hypothetical protein